MPKIKILPQNLINQIAAGEVVDRPASVIKELVENSIDAGATAIEVVVKKAGRELIAITDNGCGMIPADAKLALERHATSKIASFEDLTQVMSMGFRGEALPSIASISHFRLTTRTAEKNEGFEIKIEGGKIVEESPCAAAVGTTIAVEHIFYNVPARRKFLKSDSTELTHCVEVIRTLALANRAVAFSLKDGRREIIDIPAHATLKERVAALFPRLGVNEMLEVAAYEGQAELAGLVSTPAHPQPTRESLHFFINGRAVDSKVFSFALRDAYGESMGPGRYPAAFLFLKIPPTQVDVNVHPAKREVRLHDERGRQNFIARALISTLAGRPHAAEHNFAPTLPPIMSEGGNGLPRFSPAPFASTSLPFGAQAAGMAAPGFHSPSAPHTPFTPGSLGSHQTNLRIAEPTNSHGWRFLGFAHGSFAIFTTPEGVCLLHTPSAQAAVAADRVAKALAADRAGSQSLLVPALLQLEGKLEEALHEHLLALTSHGFIITPFGKGSYRLEGVPAYIGKLGGGAPEGVFLSILGSLAEGEASATILSAQRLGALIAKSSAHTLSHAEAALGLVGDLLSCANPLKAPDGHPTFWEIQVGDLKKKFGQK